MLLLALALPVEAIMTSSGAADRVLAGGLGALAGLVLLTCGTLVALTRSRWPGRQS